MAGPANPRGLDQWTGRIMEFTGGHRPREMMGDYDVNPNEDSDGLSHHNRQSTATEEFREQIDPKRRREKALKDMEGEMPHISLKPEEMGEMVDRTPLMEGESALHESAMGVDMGHASRGIGISQGANVGPVRREGPGLIFSRSNDAFEDAWSLMKQPILDPDGPDDDDDDEIGRRVKDWALGIGARNMQEEYEKNPQEWGQGAMHTTLTDIDDKRGRVDVVGPETDRETIMERLMDEEWRDYMADARSGGGQEDLNPIPPSLREDMIEGWADEMGMSAEQFMADATLFMPNPEAGWNYRNLIAPDVRPGSWRQAEGPSHDVNVPPKGTGVWAITPEISDEWQQYMRSEDPLFLSELIKAKRKKRGRKYEEDEESTEDEKKAKKKRKREKKRKMKRGKREASRQPHSKTARRAASAEQNISRDTKRQAFAPRRMFSGNPRQKGLPLRLKDPIAYQRKLAAEKFRRQMGSLPTGHSAHADPRGIKGKVQTIGMEGKGTKMPSQPSESKGTSLSRFKAPKSAEREGSLIHDPLGGDPLKMLLAKRAKLELRGTDITGLNRSELLELKRDLKKVMQALERLSKATPELGQEAKVGGTGDEEKNTAPTGGTSIPEDRKPWRMICDTSVMPAAGAAGAGKR